MDPGARERMKRPQLSLFDNLEPEPWPNHPEARAPQVDPAAAAAEPPRHVSQLSLFTEDEGGAERDLPEGFRLVDTEDALQELIRELAAAPLFAFDTETTALDPMVAELVGLSFSTRPGSASYVPVGHTRGRQVERSRVLDALRPVFEDGTRPKVGHNLKFDLRVLERAGVRVAGPYYDTMILAHLVREEGSHGLKECARHYLGREMTSFDELTSRGRHPLESLPTAWVARYACDDADATLSLWERLSPEIAASGLERVFQLESELLPVVAQMESDGVAIDAAYLTELAADLEKQIEAKAEACYAAAGTRFNLNSPRQIATILYERLGLNATRHTTMGPSTGEPALKALAGTHPLPALILEHRELSKLRSTYALGLLRSISLETRRVHPSFQQIGARSGRFSCAHPNLQNLPKDSANTIRRAFAAAPGHLLVFADYSQIELRILAYYSEDPGLLAAFREGEDVHARTAAEIFRVPLDSVTSVQRQVAKGINFGLVYGMSSQGLAAQLGISQAQAERYIEAYFGRYAGVRRYMAEMVARAREQGHVTTLLGRRRHVTGLDSSNPRIRGQAERQVINAPIQGSAADIIKLAMVRLAPHLPAFRARMILQVHDELVIEVPEEEAEGLRRTIVSVMEQPPTPEFRVPLCVEVEMGSTWR